MVEAVTLSGDFKLKNASSLLKHKQNMLKDFCAFYRNFHKLGFYFSKPNKNSTGDPRHTASATATL